MRLKFYLIQLIITTYCKPIQVECTERREEKNMRIGGSQNHEGDFLQIIEEAGRATDINKIPDNSTVLIEIQNNSKPMSNLTTLIIPGNNDNSEDVLPIQLPGIDYQTNNFPYRNDPWKFLQYFSPTNIVGSLSQKLNMLSSLFTYHPNEGIINYLNPSYLFQKLSDKSQQFLANSNSAIFGFGQYGGHDYPFPYKISRFYNST